MDEQNQNQPSEAEQQEEAKPEAPALTAESISELIAAALADYDKKQTEKRTEAEKLSGLNAQERAEHERDALKTELEELQRKIAIADMQKTAAAILSEQHIHLPESLLARLVTEEAETTKKNVADFAKLFSEAVEAAVKARLQSGTPKTGKTGSTLTKKDIMAISDTEKRLKAINENMHLFQ